MYPPPVFQSDNADEAFALIEAHPLACLAINGAAGPRLVQVPLVVSGDKQSLIGHVAQANGFLPEDRETVCEAVALFRGVEGYISPNWYPSKAEHGRAVPTWNYVTVEVRGTLHIETDPAQMMRYIEPLTAQMEAAQPDPWTVSDAPEKYTASLRRAICGLQLQIREVTGIRKLSQNKDARDFAGVLNGLRDQKQAGSDALADEMQREDAQQ